MLLVRSPVSYLLVAFSIIVGVVAQSASQWTTSPFNPPAIPLAVKSPYLNSWLSQGPDPPAANEAWATFWNDVGVLDGNDSPEGITEFYAVASVDGVSYRLLGDADVPNVQPAQQMAVEITATRTSFLFEAGPMDINATFLSPIDLSNLTIMSRPTVYFYVTALSNDGKSHSLALYADTSAQWDDGTSINNTGVGFANDTTGIHLFSAFSGGVRYSEDDQRSVAVALFFSMVQDPGLSLEVGLDANVRANFAANASLASVSLTKGPPGIDPNLLNQSSGLPVLGLAVDLGSIKQTTSPVFWALTLMSTSDIQYASIDGIQHRYPYFLSQSSAIPDTQGNVADPFEDPDQESLLDATLLDFNSILLNSIAIDEAIRSDGLAVSPEYADILALSLRQVMASMEITISVGSDGQWNTSDVMSFMKNMGSLGSSVGINNVDILYSAFPAFLYLNSAYGRYLLEPLFDFQDRPGFPIPYAAQDLGSTYPNATGNPNPHPFGIEETANMIIMTYADILSSDDGVLAFEHYSLLKSWATYLVNSSLIPGAQLAPESDADVLVNMTNLALKGIIGIGAMAQISDFLGFNEDGTSFQNSAETLIKQWQQMAVVNDTLIMSYNADNVTGLLYNLYADKMLQLNLVPQTVYDTQSVYYGQQEPNSLYGIAIASDKTTTRADWMMLSAASLLDESSGIRDSMILQVHRYLSANTSSAVFPLEYDVSNGNPTLAVNSPAAGGMFAVLAANRVRINPPTITSLPAVQTSTSSSHVKKWLVIFISTFLSALGLVLIFVAYYFLRRRRQRQAQRRRQTFVRLHDLPRSTTPRATEGLELSPLPNFDPDFKAPLDADSESLSEAFARKGYLEQQRALETEEGNPPSYEVSDGKEVNADVKTDVQQ